MEKSSEKSSDRSNMVLYALLIAAIAVLAINQLMIANLGNSAGLQVTGTVTGSGTAAAPDVIPKGIPAVYGNELGVSFDDVSSNNLAKAEETISKLAVLDDQIQLTGNLLQRYINIAGSISCEYCCGAESIIFIRDAGNYKAGDAACGCAHSYAMRGLAKYLLTNHANEYSDDQILEELGKWKTLFFPAQITEKARILQQNGIELNYINLASNNYRGIESGTSGGMVGGC